MHYYILTVQIPHETLYTHGPTPGGRELIGNGGKKKKKPLTQEIMGIPKSSELIFCLARRKP